MDKDALALFTHEIYNHALNFPTQINHDQIMNILAPIMPLLVFLLLWGIFYKPQGGWRASFLSAAVTWGVLLTVITETFGLFKAISFWPIFGAWSLCLIAAILWWIKNAGKPEDLINGIRPADIPRFEYLLLGGIAFIAVIVGLIAWIAPPNTWDSMTYHMPRVMHWIQDGSVAYYPTHILRQLYLNPGSEFIILHFQILSDGDNLANSVQWFSMIGSAIGITLIAKELGSNRQGQIFSAVVSMTIPMGVLQGSSTQNDYVAAFWLTCFVYWMIVLNSKGDYWGAFAAGTSLGLAVLTKGTAYIYALPFLMWLSLLVLRSYRMNGIALLGIIAFCVAAINLGYYLRNYALFSNPFGLTQENLEGSPTIAYKIPNDVFSVPELISNVVRNTAIHLNTPSDTANSYFEKSIYVFHQIIGISPNDPRTTWPGTEFHVTRASYDEVNTGNLLHVILITVAILLVVVYQGRKQNAIFYSTSLIAGFLIFSLYLKWQPWNSRLQLPLFVLWSPIIGISVSALQRGWIAKSIMTLLLIETLPWLFFNHTRPLIGPQNILNTARIDQYFPNYVSPLEGSYVQAVEYLTNDMNRHCKQIGLYTNIDDWEYPFWVLLGQGIGKDIRIESVNVENVSAKKYSEFPQFTPCAILAVNSPSLNNIQVNGTIYSVLKITEYVSILTPK